MQITIRRASWVVPVMSHAVGGAKLAAEAQIQCCGTPHVNALANDVANPDAVDATVDERIAWALLGRGCVQVGRIAHRARRKATQTALVQAARHRRHGPVAVQYVSR